MLAATTANRRPAIVADRSYYLGLARAHHALGNRSGRSWAIENARRAPVRTSAMALRLQLLDLRAQAARIDRCTGCDAPAHASETNDDGLCVLCMQARGITPITPDQEAA